MVNYYYYCLFILPSQADAACRASSCVNLLSVFYFQYTLEEGCVLAADWGVKVIAVVLFLLLRFLCGFASRFGAGGHV